MMPALRKRLRLQRLPRPLARLKRWGTLAVASVATLVIPATAYASIGDFLLEVVGRLFYLLTRLMGLILILEVDGLVKVAQYNNFVAPGPTAVVNGWIVTRDLANMFFILVLLIIAFATILSYETYSYRQLLPRLLIMAVVINFSKTIAGVLIDFGQVVMLTFVNGFKAAAGGNFMRAFQVEKLLELHNSGDLSSSGLALAMILAFIMVSTATAVVLIMLVVLVFRIVMLWVLIILSPIAFLASTLPPAKEYYDRWWKEFRTYVISGPIIAFFLWLALLSAQKAGESGGNIATADGFTQAESAASQEAAAFRGSPENAGFPNEAGTTDAILSLVIVTALLMAGLKITLEMGVMGAGFGKALKGFAAGKLKKWGKAGAGSPLAALRLGRRVAGAAVRAPKKAVARGGFIARQSAKLSDRMSKSRLAPVAAIGRATGGFSREAVANKQQRLEQRYGSLEEVARTNPNRATQLFAGQVREAEKLNDTKRLQSLAQRAMGDKNLWNAVKGDEQASGALFSALADKSGTDAGLKKTFNELKQKDFMGSTTAGTTEREKAARRQDVEDLKKEELAEALPDVSGGQLGQVMTGDQEKKKVFSDFLKSMGTAEGRVAGLSAQQAAPAERRRIANMSEEEAVSEYLSNKGVKGTDLAGFSGNPAVAKYLKEAIKNDPKARARLTKSEEVRGNLQAVAREDLAAAKASGDNAKIANATVDAINFGAIKADEIRGDSDLRDALGDKLSPGRLAKSIDTTDPSKVEAAQAATAAIGLANPAKYERIKRNGLYDDIIDESEVTRMQGTTASSAPAPSLSSEDVQSIVSGATQAVASMRDAGGSAEEIARLNTTIESLNQQMRNRETLQGRISSANDPAQISALTKEMQELNTKIGLMARELPTP